MAPQVTELVSNFLKRTEHQIPLPLAAEAAGLGIRDRTNWQQRHLLPCETKKLAGRLYVNATGLIALGLMTETAWLVGPETAAAIAKAICGQFFSDDLADLNVADFRDTVVYFYKPLPTRGGIGKLPRFPTEDEDVSERVMGFPLLTATAESLAKQPVPNASVVILPVGQLLTQWAAHIESELETQDGLRETVKRAFDG